MREKQWNINDTGLRGSERFGEFSMKTEQIERQSENLEMLMRILQ